MTTIANISSVRKPRQPKAGTRPLRMTEEQFVAWADDEIYAEWVNGEVIHLSPISVTHDRMVNWLHTVMQQFVESHDLGEVFGSEYTMRLADQRSRRLPDVFFVKKSRLHLIQQNHFEGVADLVMEVVSPASIARDWREKFKEYETAGVKEYWVIDPQAKKLEAYTLTRGKTYSVIKEVDGKVNSKALPGFWIRTEWLFQSPLPGTLKTARELGLIK